MWVRTTVVVGVVQRVRPCSVDGGGVVVTVHASAHHALQKICASPSRWIRPHDLTPRFARDAGTHPNLFANGAVA
jgi:hypothetical protein